MNTIIDIQNITKSFGTHKALDDVSFSIPEGSIFGLLGPNGAGKTTLLRILNQIFKPDQGVVLFKNHPLDADDVLQFGYLPEERGLYKKMKIGEQAIYLAQLKGLSKQEATRRLKEWFEKFEITEWWYRKLEELSKGMQQKIQFIITILHEPKLLIFDEPFSGFDPINTNLLKNEILELNKKGATIIFSTHNMASVEEICQEIVLINNGKNILNGTINEVKNRYKTDLYSVTFDNEIALESIQNPLWEIQSIQQSQHKTTVTLKVKTNSENNFLLSELSKIATIRSFSEELLSINDIFIRVVEQK
jgi:ABC-2 type transport system ATP-binding protein